MGKKEREARRTQRQNKKIIKETNKPKEKLEKLLEDVKNSKIPKNPLGKKIMNSRIDRLKELVSNKLAISDLYFLMNYAKNSKYDKLKNETNKIHKQIMNLRNERENIWCRLDQIEGDLEYYDDLEAEIDGYAPAFYPVGETKKDDGRISPRIKRILDDAFEEDLDDASEENRDGDVVQSNQQIKRILEERLNCIEEELKSLEERKNTLMLAYKKDIEEIEEKYNKSLLAVKSNKTNIFSTIGKWVEKGVSKVKGIIDNANKRAEENLETSVTSANSLAERKNFVEDLGFNIPLEVQRKIADEIKQRNQVTNNPTKGGTDGPSQNGADEPQN